MEEIVTSASNGERSTLQEGSDSNSSPTSHHSKKRADCTLTISSTPKYKGVVVQPNGHCGCQIYHNHSRIWLGTFQNQKDAAEAYDRAALKLQIVETRRNFPSANVTFEEVEFQSRYTDNEIFNLIRDGSYQQKLDDFIKSQKTSQSEERGAKIETETGFVVKQLFQKELTPSDVGKLNRLVIPKKYAVKYFPCITEGNAGRVVEKANDVIELAFYDKSMNMWKFRYCYWTSSQSYVFTRGWNKFVKEKRLKANDTIGFFSYEHGENSERQTNFMIEVMDGDSNKCLAIVESDPTDALQPLPNELGASATERVHKQTLCLDENVDTHGVEHDGKDDGREASIGESLRPRKKSKSIMLFGVQIQCYPI